MKLHIIAIIMAGIMVGCASPAAQCRDQVKTFMAKAIPVYNKFKDTTDLASSTARISLPSVIKDMQSARRDWSAIEPLTEADVRAMLGALDKSQVYRRRGQRPTNHSLATATRNRAIILLLLDTGLRASELCDLTILHCDIKNRTLKVMGKGAKERILPFSPSTGQAIWRYLATRKDAKVNEPLIATPQGRPIGRDDLRRLIANIGQRAGVHGAYPHRFRHTFAINFLRNGGNAYALQMALGHASMDMVRKYLALAQTDIAAAHQIASPVANWRL